MELSSKYRQLWKKIKFLWYSELDENSVQGNLAPFVSATGNEEATSLQLSDAVL